MAIKAWGPLFCWLLLAGIFTAALSVEPRNHHYEQPARGEPGEHVEPTWFVGAQHRDDSREQENKWYQPVLDKFLEHITDWLLVLFNGILATYTWRLFTATNGLWKSTDSPVTGAEDTAKRQLRAYISVYPNGAGLPPKEEIIAKIFSRMKNHGQTPARAVNHVYRFEVLPNPLPAGFNFPEPNIHIRLNSTIPPNDEMKTWFNTNKQLSIDEFYSIEKNASRFYVWGKTYYTAVFGWETKFIASIGGPEFVATIRANRRGEKGPGFDFEWGDYHNEGT